jgi:putative DNA primase/helicase
MPKTSPAVVKLASAIVVERSKYTDQANAERFVEKHGENVKWVPGWKTWVHFDDTRWVRNDLMEVERLALETARSIWDEISDLADSKQKEACAAWAKTSENRKRHLTMLEHAKPLLAVSHEIFDRNPLLFNCPNGTIDLRTGKHREHRREDLITKCCSTTYDDHAECPIWKAHLDLILADPELSPYLRRAFGYSMTGLVIEEILFFLYGYGHNGKSVTLKAVQNILGDYSMTTAPTLLVKPRNGAVDHLSIADLQGTRFVTTIDQQDSGLSLSESQLKQIVSTDRITGRRHYCDWAEFDPSHHVWMAANNQPILKGTDLGLWRRIHQIPFTYTIPVADRDSDIENKLKAEYPGILRWMVEGCLEWQSNPEPKLQPPKAVLEATDSYRESMDIVGEFLKDKTERDPSGETRSSELYVAYSGWCKNTGHRPLAKNRFSIDLKAREGYAIRHTKTGNVISGLVLKSDLSPVERSAEWR